MESCGREVGEFKVDAPSGSEGRRTTRVRRGVRLCVIRKLLLISSKTANT